MVKFFLKHPLYQLSAIYSKSFSLKWRRVIVELNAMGRPLACWPALVSFCRPFLTFIKMYQNSAKYYKNIARRCGLHTKIPAQGSGLQTEGLRLILTVSFMFPSNCTTCCVWFHLLWKTIVLNYRCVGLIDKSWLASLINKFGFMVEHNLCMNI